MKREYLYQFRVGKDFSDKMHKVQTIKGKTDTFENIKFKISGGAQLAQSEEHATLNLMIMSSSSMLGVVITEKQKRAKKANQTKTTHLIKNILKFKNFWSEKHITKRKHRPKTGR